MLLLQFSSSIYKFSAVPCFQKLAVYDPLMLNTKPYKKTYKIVILFCLL